MFKILLSYLVTKVKPCMNGGVVVPLYEDEFECICKNGFFGPSCEGMITFLPRLKEANTYVKTSV